MPSILQRRRYTFRRQRLWTPSKAAFRACWAAGANAIYRVHAMKKNVAGQKIGAQLVSATDGSAFTGSVTVSVTVDAGIQATGTVGSGACTHEGNGYHTYAPSQAETNGDLLAFTFTGSGAIPVTIQVYTIPTTGILAPTVADRTLDVSAGGEAGIDWANVGTPGSTVSLSATTVATVTTTTTATNVTTVNGIAAGAITAAAIATDAIDADALAADAIAEINATVDTALADVRLDELLAADSDIDGAAPPTVGSVFHELMTKTAGSFTYDQTTDSLEALRDRGDAAWITATGFSTHSAADVWAVATRQLTGTQTFNLTGNITGNLSGSVGSVTGAVGSVTGNVGGNVTGSVGSIATGGIAAASFAAGAINAAAIATDAGDEIADRVWEDVTSDHSTAGTFGYAVRDLIQYTGTDIPALITTVDTVVDAIKVKTDYLPSATAGASGGLFIAGSNAATTVNITGNITGNLSGSVGSVTGTIGGLSAAALKDFFDTDSTTTYASAVAGSVVKEIVDNAGGGGLTVGAIADAVWDEQISGHLTAGTTGYALNAAGSAGDPWSTTLPGSYTGTQAGFVFGTLRASNLNILSPYVAEDNSLELVIGDDYYAADNRNLQFTYGASPSLSGATVYLDIQTDKDSAFEGTNITSTSGSVSGTTTQLVSFDLPGTTTDDFDEGWRAYRVRAVLSNSHTVTLTRGRLNMLSRGNDAPV